MTMHPCAQCAHSRTCDLRKEKLAAVRGLKLVSVRFRCPVLEAEFQPGAVCVGTFPAVWGIGLEGPEAATLSVVFMGWSKDRKKAKIYIPVSDNEGYGYLAKHEDEPLSVAKVWPKYLKPTGEAVKVCRECGLPSSIDRKTFKVGSQEWMCDECNDQRPEYDFAY